MRSFLHDCWPLVAAFALATLCTVCFGADQKPLVINPTTGKQEQLQPGNRLSLPDASGDLVTIAPGVQTAARVISYPVLTADDTLAALGVTNVFSLSQYVLRGATSNVGWATQVTADTQDRWRVRVGGQMDWGSGSAATDVGILRNAVGQLVAFSNTASSSPITGTLVISPDGTTPATSVGIGGGIITLGGNLIGNGATDIYLGRGSTTTTIAAGTSATSGANVRLAGPSAGSVIGELRITGTTVVSWNAASGIVLPVVGTGVSIKEGTNARMGAATLVGGTVTVNTTAVTASSRIYLTSQADGGTPGFQRISARSAGTSFTITSSSGTDTSTVAWMIVEPAP